MAKLDNNKKPAGWPINTEKYHFIPMPKEWIGQYFNGGCTEPCDMLSGPCACGATHHIEEWIISRKKLVQGKGWVNPSESR